MFRWFESRIDAFPAEPPERPPATLLAYYLYFIKPIWPAFAALLVAGLLGALIEVALMTFIGDLVDLMKAARSPANFISEHGGTLLGMAIVAVVDKSGSMADSHCTGDSRDAANPSGERGFEKVDIAKEAILRARPHQEPDHLGSCDQPRALVDAPLRAAPKPRFLSERLRRPGCQQNHAGRTGAA